MGNLIISGLGSTGLLTRGLVVHSASAVVTPPVVTASAITGFPTVENVIRKLSTVVPIDQSALLLGDLTYILQAVIYDFQSPVGRDNMGGTGRSWVATTEQRYFDGNGYSELSVDEYDPTQPITVSVYNTPFQNILPITPRHGLPSNQLAIRNGGGYWNVGGWGAHAWCIGTQNIAVTATWGSPVTPDIWEAIRCEACYRALTQGYVDLAGIGSTIKMSDYEFNSSAGVSVWEKSSPIAIFHRTYLETVSKYRDLGTWRTKRMVPILS